jgi:hypothetical protein
MKAADGPLKLEGAITFRVQRFRFCRRARHQLDLRFVERIDQGDKAGGFIALVGVRVSECRAG